jgi:type IV fimbrial biogenesis protein FimT
MMQRPRGFTLIELMMVIAVVAILVTLAAPSFYDFIAVQRLKSITAQVVTDLQFARTEAASRNLPVLVRFSSNSGTSCYVVYAGSQHQCDCINTQTPVCPASASQIRTVQVPTALNVTVTPNIQSDEFSYDPATGAMRVTPIDLIINPADPFLISTAIDSNRNLRVQVKVSGRPSICAPAGSTVTGVVAC